MPTSNDPALTTMTVELPARKAADLREFSKRLYETHQRIFSGLDEAEFHRCVFDSNAEETRIRAYIEPGGRIVGYAAVQRHRRIAGGDRISVFRAQAGLLPEYRASGRTFWFFMATLLRHRLRHPVEPAYILASLVHPSSYIVFARYFPVMYPKRDQPTPGHVHQLVHDLAASLNMNPVDSSDPFVTHDGWVTRHSNPYWEQTDDPDVLFYRRRNPGFGCGHGLIVLVPITIRNVTAAASKYVRIHLLRRSKATKRGMSK